MYGKHYGGPTSGIWCERCRRAGNETKMCAAREPRRFNGLCDTCCWFGHLSCDCLLQRDRIYSDLPTFSSPPQSNRGGPGYDIPCYPPQQKPPSYSGRSGGPGYDIPCYPPQQTPPSYSDRSSSLGYDIPCYPPQQTPPSYSGRSGGPGYDIPCYPPQQPAPRPFSSFVRDQRYYGGNSTAPPQQPRPRPFSSFGREQRGACRDGPPVNGLANSIAQGQTQQDVQMDCHGGPVSKMSGPPETTTPLARGGPLYRHASSDGCNHLVGPSHRQPSLSRTRPLINGFSRTT